MTTKSGKGVAISLQDVFRGSNIGDSIEAV